jgi:hypothetical protein
MRVQFQSVKPIERTVQIFFKDRSNINSSVWLPNVKQWSDNFLIIDKEILCVKTISTVQRVYEHNYIYVHYSMYMHFHTLHTHIHACS